VLYNALMATLNPGDEVVILPPTGSATPTWCCWPGASP
jgi:Aspartate/tyrosine/aromatic aminotransferase